VDAECITQKYNVNLNADGLAYSQEVYFLGFPFVITMPSVTNVNNANDGFPFPLVKKACVSALHTEEEPSLMLLDGINNKGFSGGPVCFYNINTNNLEICGVISGYYSDEKDNNTGLIKAYRIDEARTIISLL